MKTCMAPDEVSAAHRQPRLARYRAASRRLQREAAWNNRIIASWQSCPRPLCTLSPVVPATLQLQPAAGRLSATAIAVCTLSQQFQAAVSFNSSMCIEDVLRVLGSAAMSLAAIHQAGCAHMDIKPSHATLQAKAANVQWVDTELAHAVLPLLQEWATCGSGRPLLDDQNPMLRPSRRHHWGAFPTHWAQDDGICQLQSQPSSVMLLMRAVRSCQTRAVRHDWLHLPCSTIDACQLQMGSCAYLPPEATQILPRHRRSCQPVGDDYSSPAPHAICCCHPWQARDAFAFGVCLEHWLLQLSATVLRDAPFLTCLHRLLVGSPWWCRISPYAAGVILQRALDELL